MILVWLNGGPGCSSSNGLSKENGPLLFPGDSSSSKNKLCSWTKLANVLYIDQSVGTGSLGVANRPKRIQTQHSSSTDGSKHSMQSFQD